LPDIVATAASTIRMAGYSPTAFAINPGDWTTFRTGTGGGEGYTVTDGGVERLWGLPVSLAPSVPIGTIIVADWSGAVLYRHQNLKIVSGHVDSDLTKNLLTVLGESSIAIAVVSPPAFVRVTLA
jgi:hypothetical protein